MKKAFSLWIVAVGCLTVAACYPSQKQDQPYQRKIYLTEQDYLDDLDITAQAERREAKPNTESEYIYRVQPETQKNVYFFDERVRPMVPGQPSDREYKNTKRLWQKPKRYSPQQYYGSQPVAQEESSSSYQEEYDY